MVDFLWKCIVKDPNSNEDQEYDTKMMTLCYLYLSTFLKATSLEKNDFVYKGIKVLQCGTSQKVHNISKTY